ncbi:colanic acid biosynthesis glycosyl transferase WcaI [Variovorax sp. 54]|uniref:glycosyltransferase WbuB n=1 Tax=Variovorax sp. 54 TaxID=2035212 RepID=UPI000C175CD8|nr:glycosyltransferase WbuB [Variovorax sp. 54]PIF73442.1 colanic acid biosynthesis glycosyl transferase WcaI [Variovorax sp. 54]
MKILLYSMNFAPELAGIGKYSGEMADWLQARGHDVRVIAAPPFFPHWAVFEGHSAWAYRKSEHNGLTVWRAPTWVPAQPRALARVAHLVSFMLSSLPLLLAQARWKPDLVFVVEPPVFCAPAVLFFSKVLGIQSWLHIQDHEVDAAFSLGHLRGAGVRRVALSLERWLLTRFDRVSTLSAAMMDKARSKGIDEGRLVLFPNWVDVSAIHPAPGTDGGYRAELGIAPEAVVVLYAGSLGSKQGIELLAEAAGLLADQRNIHFVICGNGPSRGPLMSACAGLDRVHFLDLQPAERLNELLGMADIHVLPQRADAADLVMPSKLGGMLASGKAVIATAHPGTELGNVVAGRGLVVPPGDAAVLADAIAQLAHSPALRETLGAAGRAFAQAELDQDAILSRFEQALLRCVADRGTTTPAPPLHESQP